MLLLGIDLGTSSVKVSVVDANTQKCIGSATYPDKEAEILSPQAGWAEQDPAIWWEHVQRAILKCHANHDYNPKDISAIGIAYQMHGLVTIDWESQVLRNSIIWCDSRAVDIGETAFEGLGRKYCLENLLNSPGNFTASKLKWIQANEPKLYARIAKIMLPGDYIVMKFTGEVGTTPSALSEGIFWDFKKNSVSPELCAYYGFDENVIPTIKPVFSEHGRLLSEVAQKLLLRAAIPVSYKAGDQLNNALGLHVMEPGEVAATAGTSGVVYAVSETADCDTESRYNCFAHVNHNAEKARIGNLLCINGAGSFNRWIKNILGDQFSYPVLNQMAASIPAGCKGLISLPFGNGAERMSGNRVIHAQFKNIDLNLHTPAYMMRSVQEGIAFAFRYGIDIMRENGIAINVVRTSKANLFLSDVFVQAFAAVNHVAIEFYDGDGSYGAALGASIGAGHFEELPERKPVKRVEPNEIDRYEEYYSDWKRSLDIELQNLSNQ